MESQWSNMGERRSVLLLPLLLLLLDSVSQLWAFPFSPSLDLDVTPRTTVLSTGERQAASSFYLLALKGEARQELNQGFGSAQSNPSESVLLQSEYPDTTPRVKGQSQG